MTNLLTQAEANAFIKADIENLVPVGDYKVKITSIEPSESDPDRKCFKFKVLSDPYRGRVLRAWPSTAPDLIWTLKKLIGEVVVDPNQVQLEDLEGHVFMAEVSQRKRSDTGEMTYDVVRLTPWVGDREPARSDEDEDY
jgi:hypothetical protein